MRLGSIPVRPGDRLLLDVLRQDTDAVRNLRPSATDWQELLKTAQEHQVPGLVADRLSAFSSNTVPTEILDRCHEWIRKITMRNLVLLEKAFRLGQALEEEGIRCVLLKGASLAGRVYTSPELRVFRDLDVLVSEQDMDRSLQILTHEMFEHLHANHDVEVPCGELSL